MAQPKYHILKSYANGVMDQTGKFYPYKTVSFTASGSIPAKNNTRYYVETIQIQSQGLLSTGPLVDKVEGVVERATVVLAQVTSPVVIAAVTSVPQYAEFTVDQMCDLATAITVTIACASPIVIVQYAAIDEEPGDYQG